MVFIRGPMPAASPSSPQQPGPGSGSGAERTSFRPPWVKEPPPSAPASSTPWVRSSREGPRLSRDEGRPREARFSRDEGVPSAISRELTEARERLNAVEGTTKPPAEATPAPARKLSKITIFPSLPQPQPAAENGHDHQGPAAAARARPGTALPDPGTQQQAHPGEDKAGGAGQPAPADTKHPAPGAKQKAPADTKQPTPGAKQKAPADTKQRAPADTKQRAPADNKQPTSGAKQPVPAGTKQPSPNTKQPSDTKQPAATDAKPAAAKDETAQKPQLQQQPKVPVKDRYKDVKPDGPREEKMPVGTIAEDKERTVPVVVVLKSEGAPPAAPPPPPPPPAMPGQKESKAMMSRARLEKLDTLRSRPRRRPDWGTMMKEIEIGRKLNHVVCNDRSAPLLATPIKVKEQFMYESEKPNVHNILLEQIQKGVHLKRVKCNDRSKPILDGLRKFRRQMTIEEQTQKEGEGEAAEPDELDDIDRVRDDLQSTKQMLALELRNKEAMDRENKRLQAKLLNLELELEREKASRLQEESPQQRRIQGEEENLKLRKELDKVQKVAEEMENKYHETVGELELARGELADIQRKNDILQRRVSNYAIRDSDLPLVKQPSAKKITKSSSAVNKQGASANNANEEAGEEEESEYEEETESEEETSEEEDEAVLQERRTARELKLLSTKIKSFKDKEEAARKERVALKEQLKKLTKMLKEEKKRYKVLEREVASMASVLKEDDEEESEEDEDEEETESESESDSEGSDDESDGDLPPEAPVQDRRTNLTNRSKKHENILAILKKGNYMLKANVDRVKDNLFNQKEMAITLQEDLNAVLAELG